MNSTTIAQQALSAPSVLASAAAVVWIVELTYLLDDVQSTTIVVERSPLAARPDGEDLIPAGAELLRSVTFPAESLRSMPLDERQKHRKHFAAYRLWCRAQDMGLKPADLIPHVTYDPVMLDEDLQRWLRPFNRYAD